MNLKFEQTGLGAFGLITIDGQLHGSVSPELAAWIVAKAELEIEMCVCGVGLDAPESCHHGRHTPVKASREVEFGPALTASTEVEI